MKNIARLFRVAQKPERRIIGLMSGTSLDGLDVALCRIAGSGPETQMELERFVTMDYSAGFRDRVREVFAKRAIDQQVLCGLNAFVGLAHGNLVNEAMRRWQIGASDIDLIASHGQTVYHAPRRLTRDERFPNSTLQIGDGDHIAVSTGIITVSDFRQKHLAAGGEGAPLAAYGDFLLFSDDVENRFLLNIGGISNFTFLPRKGSETKAYATDIGPGNTMMNRFMLRQYGLEMDRDARVARRGTVSERLLEALLSDPFLREDFPKTTGPEFFNLGYLDKALRESGTEATAPEDVVATLNRFSAEVVCAGIARAAEGLDNVAVYVSGGGLHNPKLIENIKLGLPNVKTASFAELGLDPDAKEACLFALLANETVAGDRGHVEGIKDSPAVCMGKISLFG